MENLKAISTPVRKSPSFKDYRVRDSAYMRPDKGFTKQLKCLDPEFDVVWDWGSEKWEIWKFPKEMGKESYHVLTVQTKGKTYRELGTDILVKLQAGQVWKRYSVNQLCDYLEEMDNQIRRRKAKDFQNKIEAITKETFNYSRGVLQIQVPREMSVRRAIQDA